MSHRGEWSKTSNIRKRPFCNLCRLGKGLGVDAQHCMGCNSCMSLAEHASHACRRLPEACPACAEPLFDSPRPYRQFPCGEFFVVCSSVFYECSRFFFFSLALSSLSLCIRERDGGREEEKMKKKKKKREGEKDE